jgi:O-antigen ligase
VAAVLIFGLAPIVERFGQPDDLRLEAWPVILQAANGYLPLGSGIGSFDTVYRSVESLDQVGPVYLNHAHNDLLELWLETGLAGAIVLAVFLAWLVRRSIEIWRSRGGGELAAGSSLLVLLLFAHSAVDYPLRTESLVVLFAFACANVVGASKASSARQPHTSEAGPHLKAGDA